jgi:hypothetical protein
MKITKTLVYALALCLSLVSVAEAKGRSGATFKGGFSSQRQKAPKPAPTYQVAQPKPAQATNPAFGSFGSGKASAQQGGTYQPSQMSRDMTDAKAQANAQKAWDARNKPQSAQNQTANKSDSGWFRSGNQTAQTPPPNYNQGGRYNDGGHYNQGGQYRNERRGDSGGGFWSGVMWFMLGHSLANSSHANTTVVTVPANTSQQSANAPVNSNLDLGPGDTTQTNSARENSAPADTAQMSPAPQVAEPEPESALVSLLRAVLWTLVAVVGFWMIRGVMRIRNRQHNRRSNYSLGK